MDEAIGCVGDENAVLAIYGDTAYFLELCWFVAHAGLPSKCRADTLVAAYLETAVKEVTYDDPIQAVHSHRRGSIKLPRRCPKATKYGATTLVVADLEIGDYALDLEHPEMGKKSLKIDAGKVSDGRVYLISGMMGDAALKLSELPQ